jgi:hypothetical protein
MTLEEALTRIAELEAQLSARPAPRKRKASQPECQYCGDSSHEKVTFRGLPLCSEWKPCASRIRRNHSKGIILAPERLREAA